MTLEQTKNDLEKKKKSLLSFTKGIRQQGNDVSSELKTWIEELDLIIKLINKEISKGKVD